MLCAGCLNAAVLPHCNPLLILCCTCATSGRCKVDSLEKPIISVMFML